MELYTYHRSVAAHRVRIILNIKGLSCDYRFVDIAGDKLQRYQFRALNPQGLAPVLVDDGHVITQSMAIMEYLEERWPTRSVLPKDSLGRARVRALAQLFVSDIQPLHNLRVLRYLRSRQGQDDAQIKQWSAHWIAEGLMAAEHLLASSNETGTYCHGDHPSIADACLIPEVHEAIEQGVDLSAFPVARRIYATCMTLAAFQAAAPETQRDAAGLSATVWA
ncbi:MAG: maleylacetoacetate isomerase [Pseudomonadota bacterium]|nr:maleylacetoacetate isomerase [Candidatus Acidoferrales bacterium]